MSNHLIDCAALVQGLQPRHKLLLLCLADDARDGAGRVSRPGREKAMLWSGLQKSALHEALSVLADAGLVQQLSRGQKHQRAEYLVFPNGCCDVHSRLDKQVLPDISASGLDRTLSDSQGPVSGSQRPVSGLSGSGLDRTPPLQFPRELPSPLPPAPADKQRAAKPQRVEEEVWSEIFETRAAFEEFVAELRTIRRQHDKPTGRWTAHAVRDAISRARDAGYAVSAVGTALRLVAADPATDLPGRVAAAGPWWDAQELADLQHARTSRRQLQAALSASCGCRYGWLESDDSDAVTPCPTCRPSLTSRSHA